MEHTMQTVPDHWLVFIGDFAVDDFPTGDGPVEATSTCVSVGTIVNEPTTITVCDERLGLDFGDLRRVFDGVLRIASGRISVFTVPQEVIFEMRVGTDQPRVEVWTNHPTEPDRVLIVVDPGP